MNEDNQVSAPPSLSSHYVITLNVEALTGATNEQLKEDIEKKLDWGGWIIGANVTEIKHA